MRLSKRHRYALIVIGFIIGAVIAPTVLGAVFDNTAQVSGPVSIVAPNGPNATIQGDTNASLNDPSSLFPDANTVDLKTEDGNFSATSSGPANFSIGATDITGTYTNVSDIDASSNALTIDPEDKAKLTIDGAANTAAWSDYAIDDGTVDLVVSGPDGTNSTITFYGLPPDLTITALNKTNGKPAAISTTDSSGTLTIEVDHSTQTLLLQSGDQSHVPTLSNPSPTTDLSTPPTELSVDVNDTDFPDDEVNVTIDFDGSQVSSSTLTSNSTVTYSLPSSLDSGVHTWQVNATDKFGNTQIQTYEFSVPGNIYIFNETPNATGQHELLDDINILVDATTTGSNGTAFKQTVTDGKINLTGLSPDETFIISLDTDDYYVRSVYLPNLYEQNSIYLLNKSIPATNNTVTLTDRTGQFDENPVLQIQRVINTSNVTNISDDGYKWETIGGDRMGADEQFIAHLEQTERYRFVVVNEEGDTRVLSEYVAEVDGNINLEIGVIEYKLGPSDSAYQWNAYTENETTGGSITFAYDDPSNLTDSIEVVIKNRDTGTVIANERFTNGPYGELVYVKSITQDKYDNESFVVEWSAERGGETIEASRVVGSRQGIDFPIDRVWKNVFYAAVTLLLAFLVGAGISPGAGAITVAAWSGVAWYIELVPGELGAGVVILAFAIGTWTTIQEQQTRVPG